MSSSSAPAVPSLITPALVVVSTVFPILALGAVIVRWKARRISRQPFAADDWWILVSWILTLGSSIIVWIYAGWMGIGYFKVPPAQGIVYSLGCLETASVYYQLPLAAVKISILLFYKRIFTTAKFKIAVWVAIGGVTCWAIILFFLVLCQLDPVSGSWTGVGTLRFNTVALGLAQCATSIFLDLLVLCFPIPVLHRLHMPTQRKFAIGLIFWLGLFCVIAAAVRLSLLYDSVTKVVQSQSEGFSQVTDQWLQYIFMILEPNCSIIAACLPCYGPLVAGGRGPESLVRSVRSMFSLRSQRGSKDSRDSRGARTGADGTVQQTAMHFKNSRDDGSVAESQVELQSVAREWGNSHSEGVNTTDVRGVSGARGGYDAVNAVDGDGEVAWGGQPSIKVTRGIDVTRSRG